MTTSSLGQLTVDLVVATSGFEQGMDAAARTADKKTREIERMARERARAIQSAFTAMAAPLAAVFGGATFTGMIKGLADSADGLAKMSQRTGVAVENLSKLQYAAKLSDTSNEGLANSLGKLNKTLGEAAAGSKSATEALARFNIKPGTGTAEAFAQIAEKVKNTGDATKIAAGLNDVFGKSYMELIPLLKTGAAGIQSAGDELERMGGVISGDLAAASEKFNDNLTKISTSLDALKIQSLSPTIQGLETLTDRFVKATKASGNFFAGLGIWARTSGDEENNPGKYVTELNAKLIELQKTRDALSSSSIKRLFNADDIAIVDTQIDGMTKQLKYLQELLPSAKADAGWAAYTPKPATGITDTAPAAKAIKAIKDQVSEGQKLIDQLNTRLLTTQDLTEVEQLQARLADKRYSAVSTAERDIAMSIAGQIDQHKLLGSELDQELTRIRAITDEYAAQDSRLQSLLASTPAAQNVQKMMDEALAESALRSGKIDTTQYDQILENLHGVKETGEDTFASLQRSIEGWGSKSADAIADFAVDGKGSFSDLANSIIKDMIRIVAQQTITKPLAEFGVSAISGLFKSDSITLSDGSLFASANGNVFDNAPGLSAYSGQIVSKPTLFPFARGAGLMGEAGPEAIMPLKRGADGKLGVSGGVGSGPTSITVEIKNNGSPQKVTSAQPSFDARGMVLSIITEDIDRNGPMTTSLSNKFNLAQRVY